MLLKSFVFNGGKVESLTMENTSEFLAGQVTLAEGIVILEELEKTNTILFNNLLNLLHKGKMILLTIEIDKSVTEC